MKQGTCGMLTEGMAAPEGDRKARLIRPLGAERHKPTDTTIQWLARGRHNRKDVE